MLPWIFGVRRDLLVLGEANIVGAGKHRECRHVGAMMHAEAITRRVAAIFYAHDDTDL
jgi:hypothetical protein